MFYCPDEGAEEFDTVCRQESGRPAQLSIVWKSIARRCEQNTGWKTFYRSASAFSCKLFAISCFEFEYPRTVFKLVMMVEHRIVGFSIHPHSIDDFEPTLS
jgi:hypothetical protein